MPRHALRGADELGEQLVWVERPGRKQRLALGIEPGGAGPVIVELEPIAVGVAQIDRDRRAVIRGVVDRVGVLQQPLDGTGQRARIGVEQGDMVQSGMAGRRRCTAFAQPGVQADLVVIVACRQQDDLDANRRPVGGDGEAEQVAVERRGALEIGDAEMHMADADIRVKLGVAHGRSQACRRSPGGVRDRLEGLGDHQVQDGSDKAS